jgi:hypothetical protein
MQDKTCLAACPLVGFSALQVAAFENEGLKAFAGKVKSACLHNSFDA